MVGTSPVPEGLRRATAQKYFLEEEAPRETITWKGTQLQGSVARECRMARILEVRATWIIRTFQVFPLIEELRQDILAYQSILLALQHHKQTRPKVVFLSVGSRQTV